MNEDNSMSFDSVVENLLAKGCKKYKARVKDITITKKEYLWNNDYVLMKLTLDRRVPWFAENEYGGCEEKLSNILFVSHFNVCKVLKEKNEMGSFIASFINDTVEFSPEFALKRIMLLLGDAEIEFIQELVPECSEYFNPFYEHNDEEDGSYYDHDTYINHLTNIKFGLIGRKAINFAFENVLNGGIQKYNHIHRVVVEEAQTAKAMGLENLPVLATPALVTIMENAAMVAAISILRDDTQTTVGVQMDIKHLRPVPIGAEIETKATLQSKDGDCLTFYIVTSQNGAIVGEALHHRCIVDTNPHCS